MPITQALRRLSPRRLVLSAAAACFAPFALRLSLGRWPNRTERTTFRRGFANQAMGLPPLLRALASVPASQHWLQRAGTNLWHWQRGGLPVAGSGIATNFYGNSAIAWRGPPLAFLHIEKSGGVALLQYLSAQFHPDQINPDPIREFAPHLLCRHPALSITYAGYPLIWGHYDLPTLQNFQPAPTIFTMLREPRARLVSLYQFWRSINPAMFDADISFAVAAAHRLSLGDFLACDDPLLTDMTDNIYTRRLTGLYATGAARDPLITSPQAALDAARAQLHKLAYVGITEHFEASLEQLAIRLGLAAPGAIARGNITAHNHDDPSGFFRRAEPVEITPAASTALDRRTTLDRILYQETLQKLKM